MIKKICIPLIILGFILVVFVVFKKSNILPVGLYHLINLNKQPPDLYDPIVVDNYFFSKAGFSKTYRFFPKYKDFHEIGIVFNDDGLDSQYQFQGILRMEFLCGSDIVLEKKAKSFQHSWYFDKKMSRLRKVSFETFSSLLCGNSKEIGVKLTVEKPDILLEESGKLYIAVSAVP